MTTTEFIALAAVAITALGLLINFMSSQAAAQSQARFQGHVLRQLENMKQEFELTREYRQYVLPNQLEDLQQIVQWLDEGVRIAGEFGNVLFMAELKNRPMDMERFERTNNEYNLWKEHSARIHILAGKYERILQMADVQTEVSDETMNKTLFSEILGWQLALLDGSIEKVIESVRSRDEHKRIEVEAEARDIHRRAHELINRIRRKMFERTRFKASPPTTDQKTPGS